LPAESFYSSVSVWQTFLLALEVHLITTLILRQLEMLREREVVEKRKNALKFSGR